MNKVAFSDLRPMHEEIREEVLGALGRVYDNNMFINGQECREFEKLFASFIGTENCIGCGNGLDALKLILQAYCIGIGDEVIVPAHTYIATALAVTSVGAKPVFVDVEKNYYCIDHKELEKAVSTRTKAIIFVHIYGQVGEFNRVQEFAQAHNLILIEDAAQAHGTTYGGRCAGNLGNAAGFSFYPGKNLGALGDAGAITTDDSDIAARVRMIGDYGSKKKYFHECKGINSRLDEIQAAVLSIKLKNLDRWIAERRKIANTYLDRINNNCIRMPMKNPDGEHSWHLFSILVDNREDFIKYLEEEDVQTLIHYPFPMHLHKAYEDLGYQRGDFPIAEMIAAQEVSLPIFYGMREDQIGFVVDVINRWNP